MCGIVGYWVRSGRSEELYQALPEAAGGLRHRGPDAGGIWSSGHGVGFGHRRLAILDLTDAGAQPMQTADGRFVIVFNGEIYNYGEIGTELCARGHQVAGHSDTEVILASFAEWGLAAVDRFIGMFAFAIWDNVSRRLSLCRDRVGVKPLYWYFDGCTLLFASELKALRALPGWRPEVDTTALGEFLQYGYIAAPRTIYARTQKLSPGSWLHLHSEGMPRIERYWSLRTAIAKGPRTERAEVLEEELEALLRDAFRYRLVSDVPVGLFLSGGVDSSLVAGLIKSQGVELDTFTVGFRSASHDESESAAAVAKALGLSNRARIIDFAEARRVLDSWPDMYDEPYADASGIPTYLVSRMAREHVTVALSADGGDELFCGYSGYAGMAWRMRVLARLPQPICALGARGAALAAAAGSRGGTASTWGLQQALGHGRMLDHALKLEEYLAAAPGLDAIRPFRTFWQQHEVRTLVGAGYADPRRGTFAWPGDPIEQMAALDFHEYLPDDVLVKTDRATMAVGLEGREPLLDHRIVELAFRLPLGMRLGPLGNKHVLRSILYRHVPRELVDRPKQGFAVPIRDWLGELVRDGEITRMCDVLKDRVGLDKRVLDSVVPTFSGSAQGVNRLWNLYVLGRWAERWL
jgi:asparagine synthase (glutamine-hydrolysing)